MTNAYKYLVVIIITRLSVGAALSDVRRKGKKGVVDNPKSIRRLSTIDPCLFWKLFDTQESNHSYFRISSRLLEIT